MALNCIRQRPGDKQGRNLLDRGRIAWVSSDKDGIQFLAQARQDLNNYGTPHLISRMGSCLQGQHSVAYTGYNKFQALWACRNGCQFLMAPAPVRVVSSLILSPSLILKHLREVAAAEGNADVYPTLRLVLKPI